MAERADYHLPESWGDKAEDYDSLFVPFSGPAAIAAIDAMELSPGERFMDIAAGTGAVTIEAARRGASVVAVDFAEGMLSVLRAKLERLGINGIELHQMDGQALEFPDGTFDAAGSGFGLVWFPDPGRGLREMHRVLRPGGRAFLTTTGHPGSSELQRLVVQASMAAGATVSRPVASTMPGVDDWKALLETAGFGDVRVEVHSMSWPIPDPRRFWGKWALESPPSAGLWRDQPEAVKQAAGDEFVRLVEATGRSDFATEVLIGIGRK